MIMMGLEDVGDIPFRTVYLHGLVRDEKGEKMSKVRGNVINPIETLEKYGTDALRFALSSGTSAGNDIKLLPSRLEAGRNFANKLWNATRFVLRSVDTDVNDITMNSKSLPLEDRWILSRLNRTIASVNSLTENFFFGEAERQIYEFLWGDFCDWYIEMAKIRLNSSEEVVPSPVSVLVHVLESSLRLLHPYMPFVTEELWQNLKSRLSADWQKPDSIMIDAYPEANDDAIDQQAERVMDSIVEIIRVIRDARAEYKVPNNKWVEAQVYAGELLADITPYSQAIQSLAKASPVTLLDRRQESTESKDVLVLVLKEAEVVIPMAGMVDLEAEKQRLQNELEQGEAELTRLEARLNDSQFLAKAPAKVVDKERQKLYNLTDKLQRLRQQISTF
jgi:valyl-tRNA synthetase